MSKRVTLKIKTPTKTYSYDNYVKNASEIQKEIEKNAATVALRGFSLRAKTLKEQELSVISTFFQRVCSRTPIDEEYEIGKAYRNKEGVLIERIHKPDEITCRYDWYVEKNGVKVTAEEIHDAYNNVFDVVNNPDSVNQIRTYLSFIFDVYADGDYVVGNNNPYFATLEYGGYKNDGNIKQGDEKEHGVKNKHSIQAPVGMLRITQAELKQSSYNKFAKSSITSRFKGRKNYSQSVPSDAKLKDLISVMKKGKIPYSDIKRFMEV